MRDFESSYAKSQAAQKKTEIPYKKDWHHNLVKTTENPETQFLYMHATSPLRRKIGAPFFARHEPKTTIQVP